MPERPARHVFLIGFMAVGKTSVGLRASQLTGARFIDLDADIADRAGCTIAELFARAGEDEFRALEAQALRRVADGPPAIVATGGGAPCHGDNLQLMRARGLVIALTAPLETVRARITDPDARPLFARPPSEVRALFAARARIYRRAHACVATEDKTIEAAAARVLAIAGCARILSPAHVSQACFVALAERTYPVVVAAGLLDTVGTLVRRSLPDTSRGGSRTLALISDDNVAPLYATRVERSLNAAGFAVTRAVIPAGERSKSFAQFASLSEQLASALDRRSAIVALGGGVVGDLAGLVAATLFRGIACVQIPTTLLAMIDSAIGGKTGINISKGKNLVGAFWQPRAVLADPTVLASLPRRELQAAFGELVKYGLLAGEPLLRAIDDLGPAIAAGAPTDDATLGPLTEVILRCAADKSWIVTRDEREQTGERALLNLGHTIGHAIEAAGDYRALLHGEAVALGLLAACRISTQLGLCDRALIERVAAVLTRAGAPTDLQPWLRDEVIARVKVDKKRAGDNLDFIAIARPGDCRRVSLTVDKIARKLLADLSV